MFYKFGSFIVDYETVSSNFFIVFLMNNKMLSKENTFTFTFKCHTCNTESILNIFKRLNGTLNGKYSLSGFVLLQYYYSAAFLFLTVVAVCSEMVLSLILIGQLTLSCIMLKNDQTYFKNYAVLTPQEL